MLRRIALTGVLALAQTGCTKHSAAPLAVSKLTVSEESLEAAPALGLGGDQMRAAVEAAVKRAGGLMLQPNQQPPSGVNAYKLRAEVESAHLQEITLPDGGDGDQAEVEVMLEAARGTVEGTLKVSGTGQGQVYAPPSPDVDGQAHAFSLAFLRGVDLAAARLVRGTVASDLPTEVLRANLGSTDGGVREAAADVLVDRKDASAIPVLVEELDSPDDSVKMKAIGELVELKARQAVPKLIDLAQTPDARLGTDPHFQMQIIFALGSIGGGEAEAYLYTIGSGHPDEMVRNAARDANAELQKARSPTTGAPKETVK